MLFFVIFFLTCNYFARYSPLLLQSWWDVHTVNAYFFARRPLSARFVLWLAAPVLALLLGLWLWLRQGLPAVDGGLDLPGLGAPVTVARDAAGLPRIRAASDADAFFALGFVHAQERMWQMDYKRRLGQGRLAEIAGIEALPSDKLMRTLGLAQAAERALASLGPAEHAALNAYARGINAWIDGKPVLPPEFYLFNTRPAHWRPADSLLMIKLLALNLGANYRHELGHQVLVRHLGGRAAGELTGLALEEGAATAPAAPSPLAALAERLQTEQGLGGDGVGSNAWVVAGRHTVSGLPLLASDPHLAQQMPTQFFLAAIDGDRLHVAGATLPGVPAVVFGHNAAVAWGGTNLAADVQDLYAERIALDGDHRYERDGKSQAMLVREETIVVASAFPAFLRDPYKPLRWTVRATANGPLLSDVFADAEQPLALRWSALDADDTTYASFLAMNYAADAGQFRAALAGYVAPALSFVLADRGGNIALFAAGRIPLRGKGNGTMPAPGWDSAYRWRRYLRPDELPAIVNPPSGWIVSANQQVHADDYPFVISNSWQPPYRARRIEALLSARLAGGAKLDPDAMARMQTDVGDIEAPGLLPLLLRQPGATDAQKDALARVRAWDGRMDVDSVGGALYHVWSRHLMLRLTEQPLRVRLAQPQRLAGLREMSEVYRPAFLRDVADGKLAHWCGGAGASDCDRLARLALQDALDELRRLAGASGDGWRWGAVHSSLFPHQPLSAHPLLAPLFDRRIAALGGGRYTVDVSGADFSREKGYVKHLGAVFRQVIGLERMEGARFSIDTGQSGNPLDPHYDDLLARHRANALLPMDAPVTATLRLRPAPSQP